MNLRWLPPTLALLIGLAHPAAGGPVLPVDLLENGSFEVPGGALPAGWQLRRGGASAVAHASGPEARSGSRYLSLDSRGAGGPVSVESERIPASAGRRYRLQLYARVHERSLPAEAALVALLSAYTAEGELLALPFSRRTLSVRLGRGSYTPDVWTRMQGDLILPPGTGQLRVQLQTGPGVQALVTVDDVRVSEIPAAELHPRAGARTQAYQISPGVPAVPGFRTVTSSDWFGDADHDGTSDVDDPCPFVSGAAASAQPGLAGVGCSCLCGDVDASCTVTEADVVAIREVILPGLAAGADPRCDETETGICSGHPVRGCDADGDGACTELDAQTLESALPLLGPGASFPLPGGYAPDNCAQGEPELPGYGWQGAVPRIDGTPGYPTELQSMSATGGTLAIRLEEPVAAAYRVTAYMGTASLRGVRAGEIVHLDHRLLVNEQPVPEVSESRPLEQIMDEEVFHLAGASLVDARDVRDGGRALYERHIRRRFRRYDFEVPSDGKVLRIRPLSGFLSAVVLTPVEHADDHDAALAELDEALTREFALTFGELLPTGESRGAKTGSYQPSGADYTVFRESWMRAVEYDSRPDPGDVATDLHLEATPGEYEPVTFSIWPHVDLDDVRVEVASDLVSDDGAVLPAGSVRVWYLQQKPTRQDPGGFRIEGAFLPDWDAARRDLYSDVVQRVWLNLRVPEQAEPGVYRGTVRVVPGNAPARELSLELRVWPFDLERPERFHTRRFAGLMAPYPYPSLLPVEPGDSRNDAFYVAQAIDHLVAHGLTVDLRAHVIPRTCPASARVIDWDASSISSPSANQILELMLASPLGERDWIWYELSPSAECLLRVFDPGTPAAWTVSDVEAYLDQIHDKLTGLGFERIYLHISAEESAYYKLGLGQGWLALLDFVRANRDRWPAFRTVHTANREFGQPLALDHADIVALGMFHGINATPASLQVAQARARVASGASEAFFQYGERGRFTSGYYLWKAGATGSFDEFYEYFAQGAVNDDWDVDHDAISMYSLTKSPPSVVAHHSATRMVGSYATEEIREGIDDDAYLNTLASWRGRTAHLTQADPAFAGDPGLWTEFLAARGTLADIEARIDLDVDEHHFIENQYRPIAPEAFDAWRREAAEAIVVLKAALARGESPPAGAEIVIDAGPSGTPDPVAARGTVQLEVAAHDGQGSALAYEWSVSCPALGWDGFLLGASSAQATWFAPSNATGSAQSCDVQVRVSDGLGAEELRSYSQGVLP